MSEPRFLIRTAENDIYTYWTRAVLLIHLAENGADGIEIYERVVYGPTRTLYQPMTIEALKGGSNE